MTVEPRESHRPSPPELPVIAAVWLVDAEIDCWTFSARHEEILARELGRAIEIVQCSSEEEFLAALQRAHLAVVWRFEREWLDRAPRLEWIVTPAAGRERIRVQEGPRLAIDHGSFHGELMAETVLAFLLGHVRGVFASMQEAARGELWPRAAVGRTMRALRSSRVTILGFGAIGRWIGQLLVPFDCAITGVKRRPSAPPGWFRPVRDRIVTVSDLDSVLPGTDFLVVVLPGDPASHHLMDARRLALLPPHAALVSIGRGHAIDEAALARALDRGALAAAYLDVFETEPLPPDSPLRRRSDVIWMPHASAIAPNYLDLFALELARRFRERYLDSETG